MAESLNISSGSKAEKYEELLPQVVSIIEDETDIVANLANVAACLWETFHQFWTGFYIVRGEQLVLGPFQGPLACTRINRGRGVCGSAWEEGRVLVVPDVDQFPGHIACSSASRSEIVVPIMKNGEVVAVIDIDSDTLDSFDSTDEHYLVKLATLLAEKF